MKKSYSYLLVFILVFAGLFLLSKGAFASGSVSNHEVTRWRDNHKAAVSITFDDGYESQITNAIPLLNARNLKATFFLITSWPSWTIPHDGITWADWEKATQGHEIGSHTVDHLDLTTLSTGFLAGQLQYELSDSQSTINEYFTDQKCVSFDYPYGKTNAAVEAATSQYYIAARGASSYLNYYPGDEPQGSPKLDFFNVWSYGADDPLDVNDVEQNYLIPALQNSAWLCTHFHEVQNPGPFQNFLDYLLTQDVWIDTFGSIVRYMQERIHSTVTVISDYSTWSPKIVLSVTHTLRSSIDPYVEPLTIRSTVPSYWVSVKVQQGRNVDIVDSIPEGKEIAIYYNVIPNGEIITLTQASLSSSLRSGKTCNGFYSGNFEGNVTVSKGQTCTFVGGSIAGHVKQHGGVLNLTGVTIGDDVYIHGGTFLIGPYTIIDGDLEIRNLSGSTPNQICGTTVKGDLKLHDNGTTAQIGSRSSSCTGNWIGGDLVIHDNTGHMLPFDNIVSGKLKCKNNVSIQGGGNTAEEKQDQCALF